AYVGVGTMMLGTGSVYRGRRGTVRRVHAELAVVVAVLTAFTDPLQAAVAAPATDEIVITARKRAEMASDVPQAVSVFTAADVARFGYTTSPELVRQTPNLMWHSILGL